MSCTLARGN